MRGKAIVKRLKIKNLFFLVMLAFSFLRPSAVIGADNAGTPIEKEAPGSPKSELDKLKGEWEAVREQQIQMIREKEEQLEKLKDEIFAKMRSPEATVAPQPAASQPEASGTSGPVLPAVKGGAAISTERSEIEDQKVALQAERQKFFKEMSRQKESLRQLQASLDEKTKQLEADRQSFERQKKTVVP